MNENKKLYYEIRKMTVILMMIVFILSILMFNGHMMDIGLGIIIGAMTGIMGFNMIIKLSERIDEYSTDINRSSYQAYVKRYALYSIIFILSASRGIHVIALLVGMLTHKISIIVISLLHRKEGEI